MTNKEAIDKLITLKFAQTLQAKAFSEDGTPLEPDFEIAVNMAIEALEEADTYKRVVFTKDGEEFRVLMDTKRCLVYPISYTLEVCDALGWVLKGEEVGV